MNKYKSLNDLELMQEIARLESRALEELYDRYSSLLFTVIKKISPDEATAEQLLVDLFVVVWQKIDQFDFATGNVYTWLVTLARNKAIDNLRRNRNSNSTLSPYDNEYEDYFIIPTFQRDIDSLDFETVMSIRPKMEKALSKLTDSQKYVLHLAYYEGFTVSEISQKLNVPLETVRHKIMMALYNLRDFLIKE
ncbi:MAG: sigma-70 family RNA polymerase sigma factor [Ignavibacteriaceae bacterium]|nr:sigma-70 family RNA polymerase sigma factor [Ignavibacteriaceae bacterium]